MKRVLFGLLTCVLSLTTSPLWSFPKVKGVSGVWDFGAGYRTDDLSFSIADPSGTPNVLSKVHFEDLQTFLAETHGHITAWDHIYLQGCFDWGWIRRGKVKDSNFLGNNETDEFAAFTALDRGGSVFDLSGGLGVNVFPWRSGIIFAPLIGYSLHGQNLRMSNGNQTIAPDPTTLGGFCGLKVNYDTRWEGPWIGFDFAAMASCDWRFEFGYQHHWARFRGACNWEVLDCTDPSIVFVNRFRQEAHGSGNIFNFGTSYYFDENWGLGFFGNFQRWRTRPGGRQYTNPCTAVNTLPANEQWVGTMPITCGTALNTVTWNSFMICFEITSEF